MQEKKDLIKGYNFNTLENLKAGPIDYSNRKIFIKSKMAFFLVNFITENFCCYELPFFLENDLQLVVTDRAQICCSTRHDPMEGFWKIKIEKKL